MRNSTRLVVLRKLWTPANILTALWLDAADFSTITLNGSTVSQWRDKSGNGRHASQGVAASQPAYSESRINGKPGIFSDGIDDLMVFSTAVIPNNFTIIAVGQSNSSDSQKVLGIHQMSGATAGRTQISFVRSVNNIYMQIGAEFISPAATFTINKNQIVEWSRISNVASINLDGANIGSGTISPTIESTPTSIFGRVFQSIYSQVTIGELLIIANGASTEIRQRLEGYLAHKWSLMDNLPSDHPFRFTPPLV